jgi:hypothetical protein
LGHSVTFQPATVYKLNPSGSVQWSETIDGFFGGSIVQTSDGEYEISGSWSTYPGGEDTPTLIKLNAEGTIQWVENYSSYLSVPNLTMASKSIQTSDSGFASIWANNTFMGIIKTDSSNNTQWTKELTLYYAPWNETYFPVLFSIIETSDGAIAVIGVDNPVYSENVFGNVYFAKTQPFLPIPSTAQLPTSIPTRMSTVSNLTSTIAILVITSIIVVIVTIVSLLLFRRHRRTTKLSK